MRDVKYVSISEVEEKDDGVARVVEKEVKVFQSALSKHHLGGLGVGIYVVGERRTGK